MNNFNIGIGVGVAGVGCVGSALLNYYNRDCNGSYTNIKCIGYDKYKTLYDANFDELLKQDIIFLTLPTLYKEELEQYDKTAIHDVCGRLNEARYDGLVVVKSTVEPGTTEKLTTLYDSLDFAHNPEFLTARTAYQDFVNQSHIVIGTPKRCNLEKVNRLSQLFKLCWPNARHTFSTSNESEAMKIFCNCFYAQKISIFNEFYLLCQKQGMNYSKVRDMMLMNNWINPMHTQVPGPDGKMGYGGMCFLKDTAALNQHLKRHSVPSKMIEASVDENRIIRGEEDYIQENNRSNVN